MCLSVSPLQQRTMNGESEKCAWKEPRSFSVACFTPTWEAWGGLGINLVPLEGPREAALPTVDKHPNNPPLAFPFFS